MWLTIKILFRIVQDVYYSIKFKLIDRLGLHVWVYNREERKYKKLKAYYKKNNINPDKFD
jgi:hypothetical protein